MAQSGRARSRDCRYWTADQQYFRLRTAADLGGDDSLRRCARNSARMGGGRGDRHAAVLVSALSTPRIQRLHVFLPGSVQEQGRAMLSPHDGGIRTNTRQPNVVIRKNWDAGRKKQTFLIRYLLSRPTASGESRIFPVQSPGSIFQIRFGCGPALSTSFATVGRRITT